MRARVGVAATQAATVSARARLQFFRRVIVPDEAWLVQSPDGSWRLCRPDAIVAKTGCDERGVPVVPIVLWPGTVVTLAFYIHANERCGACDAIAANPDAQAEYLVHNHSPRPGGA